jgi:hypothetical protein
MKFEDALPAIKSGRLARRAAWPAGKCVGASEYGMRSGTASDLYLFEQYNREGSSCSFSYVGIERDLLETDWELVPEIVSDVPRVYYLQPILSELALRHINNHPKGAQELGLSDLSERFGKVVLKTYKSGRVEDLLEVLDTGIEWLMKLRSKEKHKD